MARAEDPRAAESYRPLRTNGRRLSIDAIDVVERVLRCAKGPAARAMRTQNVYNGGPCVHRWQLRLPTYTVQGPRDEGQRGLLGLRGTYKDCAEGGP